MNWTLFYINGHRLVKLDVYDLSSVFILGSNAGVLDRLSSSFCRRVSNTTYA